MHARCEDDTERRQRPSRPDRFHWTSPFLAYGTPDQCLQFYSFVHCNLFCITLSTSFWTHLGAKHWRTLIKDSFLAAEVGSICELQLAVRWVRRPCSSWQQLTHSLSHPHTIIQMSPFLTVDCDFFFYKLQWNKKYGMKPCSSWQQLADSLSHPNTTTQMSPFLALYFRDGRFWLFTPQCCHMCWTLLQFESC